MRSTALLLALCALTACGSEPGPGGTTAGEAQALDDAAEMIEDKRLPDSALRPPAELQEATKAPAQ